MLPIAVVPAAALLYRLGQSDLLNIPWMHAAGDAIFTNLPVIFAVGIAIGLTSGEGAASLAAVVGYFVFTATFNIIIPQINGKPDPNISMDVFAGILVGLITAWLYRRFHDVRLPNYLGFFGGRRFVPIITALVTMLLGVVFGIIWPPIQNGLNSVGAGIVTLGAPGVAMYGIGNRLLVPFGLHHVLNTYVWYELGSFNGPLGLVHGDQTRYFAGDPTAGNFMAGFFLITMFGLPAACLAMIRQARFPKLAAGILISAAFTSFLTGVTEPIEFAFLFVAPLLYALHCLLTGSALAICYLLNIKLGFSFSAGFIDYVLNFNKSNTTNPVLLLVVGVIYAIVYYLIFSFCISHFNLATPGRDQAVTDTRADWILPESQRRIKLPAQPDRSKNNLADPISDPDDILAVEVLAALGGKTNVQSVEGCITRLRLFVNEADQINTERLKDLGASGVIKHGKIAQVVLGTQSDRIANRIKLLLKKDPSVQPENKLELELERKQKVQE
jgi:PTS system N-acetylglucosamine-specific IIC component